MNKKIINAYEKYIKIYKQIPEMFNPYNVAEIKDIAPTITTNVGHWESNATILIMEVENGKKS